MHMWTNTLTKHSKCYKMAALVRPGPPAGSCFFYKSVTGLRHLRRTVQGVGTDLQSQGPVRDPGGPSHQAPGPSLGAASGQRIKGKERKERQLPPWGSMVPEVNSKVKRPFGRRPTRTLVAGKSVRLAMPGHGGRELLAIYLHCWAPPPQYLHRHATETAGLAPPPGPARPGPDPRESDPGLVVAPCSAPGRPP